MVNCSSLFWGIFIRYVCHISGLDPPALLHRDPQLMRISPHLIGVAAAAVVVAVVVVVVVVIFASVRALFRFNTCDNFSF